MFANIFSKLLIVSLIFAVLSCKTPNDNPPASGGDIPITLHLDAYASDYKICVFGDSGTGTSEQVIVAKALEKEKCNEVRHVGDIIYDSGLKSATDKQLQTKFLTPYQNILSVTPFYMALGNHDHLGNASAWLDIAKTNPQVKFPSYTYAETHGDVCFVTLDTDTSKTMQAQKDWLEKMKLEFGPTCRLSVAIGHHPYLSVGEHGDATGIQKDLLETSVLGHFDLYLAGHDHNLSDEGEIEGTHLMVSGAGAQLRSLVHDPRVWAASELGYLTLSYQSDEQGDYFTFRFVTVNSKSEGTVAHSGVIRGNGIR